MGRGGIQIEQDDQRISEAALLNLSLLPATAAQAQASVRLAAQLGSDHLNFLVICHFGWLVIAFGMRQMV